MKKYLTLAAAVAVTAFISVSYLAHAEDHAAKAADAATEQTMKDCETAAMKKADGTEATAEEKAASVKKCMDEKAAAPAVEGMKEEKN